MTTVIPEHERFAKATTLVPAGRPLRLRGELPGDGASKGDRVAASVKAYDGRHRRQVRLTEKFAEGGEGSLFRTDVDGHVAKIYKRERLTEDRLSKLITMLDRPIRCAGVCWPVANLYNSADEFVGYLMPEARGVELGRSVFVPQLLLKKFPGWTRKDTIRLCITILEKIRYLNDRRVILGDINPANILVMSPSEVYFVDCDSYQIEGYPCPVGTPHFTAPEVGGRDYKSFLRTQQMEYFAIATLLFMIMLPGKAPYSAVGGASPAHNIKTGNFPYPHMAEDSDATPPGKWGFIWSHMSYNVRLAFFESFKQGQAHFSPAQRYSSTDWLEVFKKYLHGADHMVRNDPMAMDIFPTRVKMKKCKTEGCENRFVPDQDDYVPYCNTCLVQRPEFVYKTVKCRNPKCSGPIPIQNRYRDRPEPEYCRTCWQDAGCVRCGYVAKKWMHDERDGLCSKCHAVAGAATASGTSSRSEYGSVPRSPTPRPQQSASRPPVSSTRSSTTSSQRRPAAASQQRPTTPPPPPSPGQKQQQPSGILAAIRRWLGGA